MNGYKINNLPDYAKGYKYIVARWCEDELWFYSAHDTEEKAIKVACEVDGKVIFNTDYFWREMEDFLKIF